MKTDTFRVLKPLQPKPEIYKIIMVSSTELSLLNLPESSITHVFSFLKGVDIIRASLLCCRTLANFGKQDFLWEKEWRAMTRLSHPHPSPGTNLAPIPSHCKGKLYKLCCKERSNRFRKKFEESLKKRRISISIHGPVRALRDLILNDLQKNKSDSESISIKLVYCNSVGNGNRPLSCRRKIAHFQSDDISFNNVEVPLVSAIQSLKTKVRFSKECSSHLSNVVSLFGAKIFAGALCLKAELPNEYQLMMPDSDGNLITNNNNTIAQIYYALPGRQSRSIGISKLSTSTPGYSRIGFTNGEYSLILESFPICPYEKNPNFLGQCALGSLVVTKWPGSVDPEFILASIPLALFEGVVSPLYRLKQAQTMTTNQPFEADRIAKFADECSIAVTVRTFGVSLWEFFLSGLWKSHQEGKKMIFDLLECQRREKFPHTCSTNQACTQDVREGLVLHTRAGFQCRIPCAVVLDATLFNPEGLPIWSISQPVQLCQTKDKCVVRPNLDISGLLPSEILSAIIRDPFTASSLKVNFCFGSTTEPIPDQNSKPKISSFVQAVILELDVDVVQSWMSITH